MEKKRARLWVKKDYSYFHSSELKGLDSVDKSLIFRY